MKKTKQTGQDEMRAEYKRSDFPELVRGKYLAQVKTKSNVVVVDPELTEMFPNGEAVNAALRSLLEIVKKAEAQRS